MRSQDRFSLTPLRLLLGGLVAVSFAGALAAQDFIHSDPPQLIGPSPPMQAIPAAPIPHWVVDDVRHMRQYPEQPPVIPHSIEGYQLSVNTNRCLSCHRREATQGSGAPMISITHYMTRDTQMLADISPRRYFCTACHVPQADTNPLVNNIFVDMADMGVKPAGAE